MRAWTSPLSVNQPLALAQPLPFLLPLTTAYIDKALPAHAHPHFPTLVSRRRSNLYRYLAATWPPARRNPSKLTPPTRKPWGRPPAVGSGGLGLVGGHALKPATGLCSPEHNHLVEEYSRAEFPLYEPPLEEGADAMADV